MPRGWGSQARGGRPGYSGRFLDVEMGGTAYGRASANVGTSKYAIGIGVFQSSFLKLLGRSHLSSSPKESCEMARPGDGYSFELLLLLTYRGVAFSTCYETNPAKIDVSQQRSLVIVFNLYSVSCCDLFSILN